MTRVFRGLLLAAGVLALSAGPAHAQATGQIFGKVTDATGGVLPGVTVTITGTGLQKPLVGTTAASGAYSFVSVPIGTYTVTFELSGFTKVTRQNIIITAGFAAPIDIKMEVAGQAAEVTVTAASPVVDTKKTTTGGTFTQDVLQNIPTARDPWQVVNMAPGVTLSGVNVGGSASGQQLTPSIYGTTGSVQWNMEGGNITDMSSNSSPEYFNFDSFEQIQVVTGGGDVSVQSSGLYINLVTKSGSNVFKGSANYTFENSSMQSQNVTEALFNSGGSKATGLSGNPLHKITNYSAEFGGPIKKNLLWFWGGWDYQDINVGIAQFFKTTASCQPPPSTFAQLSQVQGCLANDQTVIRDVNGKINYQLNASNKFQYLYTSDKKTRNARGASSTTLPEATFRQYSAGGFFPNPNHQITHTLVLSDKLVFTNQLTYVAGGFFLDFQDNPTCGSSTPALGASPPSDPTCLFNTQSLYSVTTGITSRAPLASYDTQRPSWEVKSDGNYFISNLLGGDHALKFGVGWRKNPVLTYSHYSGGGQALVQCPAAGCNEAATAGTLGNQVPYEAVVHRDYFYNVGWWTWDSYIQDSYSRGRIRINGGVRQDWQDSNYLGGCTPADVLAPNLLPQQCQGTAKTNHPFNNFSPRVSVTYDLLGNGKTAVHASYSYYYQSKITLAGGLNQLNDVNLTWGPNQASGACSAVAGASCWNDANHDGIIQPNELTGSPSSNTSNWNPATGVLTVPTPLIDPNTKIGRTREAIGGFTHELMPNFAVGLDYIYRKYDNGTTTYLQGYLPGDPNFPLSQIYTVVNNYTDPKTGMTSTYYTVCQGCTRPSGLPSVTSTALSYTTYKGLSATLNKRFTNRWMAQASFTWNDALNYYPLGSYTNPTGFNFQNGQAGGSQNQRYQAKIAGYVQLPYKFTLSTNININDGLIRSQRINGPGQVYGGTSGTISYGSGSLRFENEGNTRLPATKLVDIELSRPISFNGGRQQVTLSLDAFNLFNINTITGYGSNSLDSSAYTAISSIVPPRVLRIGVRVAF
jgi:Carboxypeptidase regulatory-like domain